MRLNGHSIGSCPDLCVRRRLRKSTDDAGNRSKKSKGASLETWTYGYDHNMHLIWVEKRATDGGTLQLRVENKFDALLNRIERTADNNGDSVIDNTERFGFDGAHTWVDLDGSNNLLYRRVYGDTIDSVVARISVGGTVVWYLTDHQNSVTGLVNSSGSSLGYISYDAWGNILTDTTSNNKDRFLYTSREWDGATSLGYFRARFYDAALGKWISMDPIGFNAGDANLYRYVANQTMMATDPSGLRTVASTVPNPRPGPNTFPPLPPYDENDPAFQALHFRYTELLFKLSQGERFLLELEFRITAIRLMIIQMGLPPKPDMPRPNPIMQAALLITLQDLERQRNELIEQLNSLKIEIMMIEWQLRRHGFPLVPPGWDLPPLPEGHWALFRSHNTR